MPYALMASAFPDFDQATLPPIPAEGWEDHSYGNDTCPSFFVAGFYVFINYAEPEQREIEGSSHFFILSECDTQAVEIYVGDDWAEVLRLINEKREHPNPLPAELFKPITDRPSAEAWIRALQAIGMAFHFEDDPSDICWQDGRTPSAEEVALLKHQVRALYKLDWGAHDCPIGFLLFVEGIKTPEFTKWQATGKRVDDLRDFEEITQLYPEDGYTKPVPGWMYEPGWFIEIDEDWENGNGRKGQFHLTIGNWDGVLDTRLEAEWMLWTEYARDEAE